VRVLILSWEYPPIVEGGLARHVRNLAEELVAIGVEVLVMSRGGRLSASEDRHGVTVHRVREPEFPRDDLDAFIAWVEHMNADMLAAALELDGPFDLVHSHDWLVADAAATAWWPRRASGCCASTGLTRRARPRRSTRRCAGRASRRRGITRPQQFRDLMVHEGG
jgi:glycosyltransferase involved in cell wall biosynthesis